MDMANRVVVNKFFLFPLFTFFLVACGGDSSDSLDLAQLEQHKGRANAPVISEVAVGDGDTIYLNQRAYGEVYEGGSVRLEFTTEQSGYTFIKITGSAVDFNSVPLMGVGLLYFREFGEYRSVVYMEEGERYAIDLSVVAGESSGNFELELIEANRESLQLGDGEYLLGIEVVGEKFYENSDPLDKSDLELEYVQIINFEKGYKRWIYPEISPNYGGTSGSQLIFRGNELGYETEEKFKINSNSGSVSGSYYSRLEIRNCWSLIEDREGECENYNSQYYILSGFISGSIIL